MGSTIEFISILKESIFFMIGWSVQVGHDSNRVTMKLEVPLSLTSIKTVKALNGSAHANAAFWLLEASIILYGKNTLLLHFTLGDCANQTLNPVNGDSADVRHPRIPMENSDGAWSWKYLNLKHTISEITFEEM